MENKTYICQKEDCTLCMACVNTCPKNAIQLTLDENGYECLSIDQALCINCGLCGNVCNRRNQVVRNQPIKSYALQLTEKKKLRKSASGGAFQAIAEWVLEQNGICYGCYGKFDEGEFQTGHIRIAKVEELHKILNSKYTVSLINHTYKDILSDLEKGLWVLFCGTPCQAQGLKAFLKKDYEKLIVADIICHGVTSSRIFNDYIDSIEVIDNVKIQEYIFRDKSVSWGTNYKYTFIDRNGKKRDRHCPREESSYMAHYLAGNLFRDSCYKCSLACTSRVSDLTLGDFWGIEKTHPELAKRRENRMSLRNGVSCVLANTQKGIELIEILGSKVVVDETDLNSIVSNNGNLRKCSQKPPRRDLFMEDYRKNGYLPIEKKYRNRIRKKQRTYRMKNWVKSYMPDWVRIRLYKMFVK